ncbi:MAG: ATP-dependent nuclease [Methanothrix sp.]
MKDKEYIFIITDRHILGATMIIQSLSFENYMAYKKFSIALSPFNILVGPNNSGKSTVIKSLQLLEAAWRSGTKRKPEYISEIDKYGYLIKDSSLPIRIENIHNEYSNIFTNIKIKFSGGGSAFLTVSPEFKTYLHFSTADGINLQNLSVIKRHFQFKIGVIPFLGPVEPKENLLTKEHVQKSINTYLSPRHFRNQWYHEKSDFDIFVSLLHETWPGMDIGLPELENYDELVMFCSENRITREIGWAGCGFQVWLQILSHLVRNKDATTLIIDEPEIYLHPDLQRKFISVSKGLGPQILIATHSVEMINESEVNDILIIDKNNKSAKRLNNFRAIQNVVDILGSVQNMHLTRLLKNKRILFFEGNDYMILKKMAHKIELKELSNEEGITIVPMGGFSQWPMVKNAELLFGTILEEEINTSIILDRDYRCDDEIEEIRNKLNGATNYLHFWERKEIENYLINLDVIKRIAENKLKKRQRADLLCKSDEIIDANFNKICNDCIEDIVSMSQESISMHKKNKKPISEENKECSKDIRRKMESFEELIKLVPGKIVLSCLNTAMQNELGVSFTINELIKYTKREEIPIELVGVLKHLEEFRLA